MRLRVLVALGLALAAALPASAEASCVDMLTFRGKFYDGSFNVGKVPLGPRVGTGQIPDCNDTGGEAGPSTPVALRRVRGVRPAIAVAKRRSGRVYVGEGFVVESPRHPLHKRIYRNGEPDETRGWKCGAAFKRTGLVTSVPPLLFRIDYRTRRGSGMFFLDARSRFDANLHRFGVPHLARGTWVRVTAKRCTASGGRWKLVARSLVNVGASARLG